MSLPSIKVNFSYKYQLISMEKKPHNHSQAIMADNQSQANEKSGCGVFEFFKKKDEENAVVVDVEMINEENKGEEEKLPTETLQRSHSNSSSSSDEDEGEDGEKKTKKKKRLKEKIKEKLSDDQKEEKMEKHDDIANKAEAMTHPDDKKGFLEKIKDKLPGQQHKKAEDGVTVCACAHEHSHEGGGEKEKKGILEMIKEKLPGSLHQNEDKHKEN